MDKLKESTSLTNHAGNVGYADVAFETSPRFNCTPLVCSLLRVVRVSIMVLWSSVTELTLARTARKVVEPMACESDILLLGTHLCRSRG